MAAGLEFVLGSEPSSSDVINLFYKNLVGTNAPESILSEYTELLDQGSLTSRLFRNRRGRAYSKCC